MRRPGMRSILAAVALMVFVQVSTANTEAASANAAQVAQAFEAWKQGRGSVFDLLAEDAVWTVAGVSPVSGTYQSRGELIARAVDPIHAQLSTPITPVLRHVVAQGDQVVVLWDGTATARDGSLYENHYAWHLQMRDGRIVRVIAFLDTWRLNELMADQCADTRPRL
jgi:ketosteroid isomerase-like protein